MATAETPCSHLPAKVSLPHLPARLSELKGFGSTTLCRQRLGGKGGGVEVDEELEDVEVEIGILCHAGASSRLTEDEVEPDILPSN